MMKRTIALCGAAAFLLAFLGGMLAFSLVVPSWATAQSSQEQEGRASAFTLVDADRTVLASLPPASLGAPGSTPFHAATELHLEVPDPERAIRTELVSPGDTDPAIDGWSEPHYVAFDPNTSPRGRLFLYLGGGPGLSDSARLLVDQGARNGFHAIALRYPGNALTAAGLQAQCQADPDPACMENYRREVLDGIDRTGNGDVDRANSIENRLLKLLSYLEASHPNDGWSAFIAGDTPNWSTIVAGGTSSGGTYAAVIAKQHIVARVCMFSAPVDQTLADSGLLPAPWLLAPHATPSERYYAFEHARNEGGVFGDNWEALGMAEFGSIVNVESERPPYRGSHQLMTDATPAAVQDPQPFHQPFHFSVTNDQFTPMTADGLPLFAPVWQYLCFSDLAS